MLFRQRHIQKALPIIGVVRKKFVAAVRRRLARKGDTIVKESTLLKNLLTASPDIIFFKDTDGFYLGGNKPHADLVGVPEHEITGKSDFDLHPDDDHLDYIAETDQTVIRTGEIYQNTGQPIEYLGEVRYFDIVKMPLRSDSGKIIGLMGVARDITRIYEAEQRVHRKNQFLHDLTNISVSYTSDQNIDNRFKTVIESAANMVEAESGSFYLASTSGDELAELSNRTLDLDSLTSYAMKVAPRIWQRESMIVENTTASGNQNNAGLITETYTVAVPLFSQERICGVLAFEKLGKNPHQHADISEEISFVATQISMVLEQQKLVRTIEYQANYDALTNIPNRKMFEESFNRLISDAMEKDEAFVLINMDLNGFKSVNDTYGHHKGDELLRQVASRLQETVRPGDIFARLGGDEFAYISRDIDSHEKTNIITDRLFKAFQAPFQLDENINVNVGASIGYALFPSDASDAIELMIAADSHMYQAKHAGLSEMSSRTG